MWIIRPPLLRFEPHIAAAEDMHHPHPVIETAEVAILYNLCIEPLVEIRRRGKGAEKRCPRTRHVSLCEIKKLLPDKLIVRCLFLGQGLFILDVTPAVTTSLPAILPLVEVDDFDYLIAFRFRECTRCNRALCTVVFHISEFASQHPI